ncbi:uncharacterized protein MELLADRAFT_101626 [Melampsora larici-populina 98AG31]|uniref:Saccharopine dehydrogenase NADP binding domain-containing protein n=1 Tax=Melampsora larici-populina (strain 98AG31 / pathotype 3-4-7) TaxID=747676 RepID=F4R6G1_MELLP|nr:uncharacterized protein MELLADRAFT_101626 [Melampsora larici-populina 98AG31]EGG11873.1 hypothetical protein MELLADRAFT_101626 [Melampsora larici-populina 98AG31]
MSFNTDRELDIIVYGATSYVGKLVCEHLKNNYLNKYDVTSKESIKIGMGGRSKEKLEKVKDELGLPIDLPIFVVDSFDVNGLENMCKVTKAVITLVGPYAKFGDGLIKACAEKGTHYFDLTGETLWVSNQITNLNIKSKLSKSIIVPSCGFDSVPSDLNTMIASQTLKKLVGKDVGVGRVTSGVDARGGVSGGTLLSLLGTFDDGFKAFSKAMESYVLSPIKGIQKDTGDWIIREPSIVGGLFVMAPHNGAIVRYSWGLLESNNQIIPQELKYGPEFTYDEFMITPTTILAFILTLTLKVLIILLFIPQIRQLIKILGPKSGGGPSEKERESGWFKMITTAHSVNDDVHVRVTMKGNKDPGYGFTSVCIAECAITVIKSFDDLPPLAKFGGVLTPVTALGEALRRRLESNQIIKIETEIIKDKRSRKKLFYVDDQVNEKVSLYPDENFKVVTSKLSNKLESDQML